MKSLTADEASLVARAASPETRKQLALVSRSFRTASRSTVTRFRFPKWSWGHALEFIASLSNLSSVDIEELAPEVATAAVSVLPVRIESLKLWDCDLNVIPPSLSRLTRLTCIDLYGAVYGAEYCGTEHLAPLTSLQNLVLGLYNVPESLSRLTNLTRIQMGIEQTADMPVCWGHLAPLTKVQQLLLGPCDLDAFPSLPRLDSVTMLQLPGEDVNAGCEHLSAVTNLRRLEMNPYGLTEVPEALSLLVHLTSLNFCENRVGNDGLRHLATLTNLVQIYLIDCDLMVVPQSLSRLVNLRRLHLDSNTLEADSLHHLAHVTNLEALYMQGCGLELMPRSLSRLTRLTELGLSANPKITGWGPVESLVDLKELYARNCGIESVPESFTALTRLTTLDLSGNPLKGGWKHLAQLPVT